jgi:two-component system, sensor histidine kinase PdtaS
MESLSSEGTAVGLDEALAENRRLRAALAAAQATQADLARSRACVARETMQFIHAAIANRGRRAGTADARRFADEIIARLCAIQQPFLDDDGRWMGDTADAGAWVRRLSLQIGRIKDPERRIRLETQVSATELETGRARAIAMLTAELLANAYDHGLAAREAGRINVSLYRLTRSSAVLSVADNGSGMPNPLRLPSGMCGLRIVGALARQIDGELVFARCKGGTKIDVVFPCA